MAPAVDRYLVLMRGAVEANGGVTFKVIGDAVQAAFHAVPQAVSAALDSQRALLAEDWGDVGRLRARMAVHAGEAAPDEQGDYLAPALNRLARLMAAGHGGQVLLSLAAQQLARNTLPAGTSLREMGQHRLRDLLEPEHVFQLVHVDLLDDFPPLKTLEARPNNLPRQPTPFLGREREVNEVVQLLRNDHAHLLTLTGPGGTGKTRLALQAAAEALDTFPDGVAYVPLAAVTDPALVPSAAVAALDLPEQGGRPVLDVVRDRLAHKRFLLLLDNCEHLLETVAALVADLLAACPGLTVLATSRAPLRLRAEREWAVPPLALPPRPPPPPTAEQLSPYAAVRLFVERAQAVRPDFTVDNESAPAVAEICWRLDGLPLAIELAAARVRLFTPEALLSRLEKRLTVLTGGPRDAPARQRTLRDAIDWSWDLLDPDEQVVFRRLGVFAGGFSLETAEAATNPEGSLDVMGLVEQLCEHSLLRSMDPADGEPRFGMLETVREFAFERLAESGEELAIRAAHAGFFATLVEQARIGMTGADEAAWQARLAVEQANVRAALHWLLERGEAETALTMAVGVRRFWELRFHYAEGIAFLERALTAVGPGATKPRALGLRALANLVYVTGDARRAAEMYEEALTIFRAENDDDGIGMSLAALGIVRTALGEVAAARSAAQEGLAVARRIGDQRGAAYALRGIGFAADVAGDLTAAMAAYEEALALFRHLEEHWAVLSSLTVMASVALQLGNLPRAKELAGEARRLAHAGADVPMVLEADVALGRIATEEGDLETAGRLFAGAVDGFAALGEQLLTAMASLALAEVTARRSEAARARKLVDSSLVEHRQSATPILLAKALLAAANIQSDLGDARAAATLIVEALDLTRSGEFRQVELEALEGVARAATSSGDAARGARLLGAAAAMREASQDGMTPSRQRRLQVVEAAAREALGEDQFGTAFTAGRALGWEDAATAARATAADLANGDQ
jgi:predicted ATPase